MLTFPVSASVLSPYLAWNLSGWNRYKCDMSNQDDLTQQERISAALGSSAVSDDLHDTTRPRSPAEVLEPARAPEPPSGRRRRRTHPFLVLINAVMSLLIVALLALGGIVYFAKLQFDKHGPLNHTTVFVIPRGEGVNGIAERLEHDGIISDRRIFVASVIYFKVQDQLKAGEYEIRKFSSMRDVLDKLVEGRSVLHKISLPEGLTSEQIVARLNAHQLLKGEIPEIPPEGSLLPDTYKFSRGMTRQDLIDRMRAEQRKFIQNVWSKRQANLPFKTPREAIILASIVEKETSRADERSRISGVFVNRLRKGIRLQSDPTIIYGIAGGKGSLGRGILKSELEKDTPYNTYKITGLTPTPIANPGRAAIEAVLNPADTKDLYFVADGSGGHAFSSSLAKHNKNVAAWRKIESERRKQEEAEARTKGAMEKPAGAQGETKTEGLISAAPSSSPEAGTPPDSRVFDRPAISGLPAETLPGSVSGSFMDGLTISLPPPDGGVSLQIPAAEAPAADAATPAPATQASDADATGATPPPPKRKPAL